MNPEPTTTKRRVGRPLMFESPEALLEAAAPYFEDTPRDEWTITGLAVHLDTSRVTLMEYEGKPEFVNAVKKLKDKIEMAYEISLRKRGGAGDIFGLKNFGWVDRYENTNENTNTNFEGGEAPQSVIDDYVESVKRRAA